MSPVFGALKLDAEQFKEADRGQLGPNFPQVSIVLAWPELYLYIDGGQCTDGTKVTPNLSCETGLVGGI